jgi:hypothetical protein
LSFSCSRFRGALHRFAVADGQPTDMNRCQVSTNTGQSLGFRKWGLTFYHGLNQTGARLTAYFAGTGRCCGTSIQLSIGSDG